jgi:hypothetical protein
MDKLFVLFGITDLLFGASFDREVHGLFATSILVALAFTIIFTLIHHSNNKVKECHMEMN